MNAPGKAAGRGASRAPRPTAPPLPFRERFDGDVAPGDVVGHGRRGGFDVEAVIGIDGGAARFRPLVRPGWGRSVLSYGPYRAEPGLAMSAHVLNGHQASSTERWPPLSRIVAQWLRGTQVDTPLRRLWQLQQRPVASRDPLARRGRAWLANRYGRGAGRSLEENLAVGWFGSPAPVDAIGGGPAFVVRSTGPTNAELWAGLPTAGRRVRSELADAPLQVVVALTGTGALYAICERGPGDGAPKMYPLALDPAPIPAELWAGAHQSVLGELGWGADTRLYGFAVSRPAQWSPWWACAHAADRLGGQPIERGRRAEIGGAWDVHRVPRGPLAGDTIAKARGTGAAGTAKAEAQAEGTELALLQPGAGSAVVHLAFSPVDLGTTGLLGLAVRCDGGVNGWFVHLTARQLSCERRAGGRLAQRFITPAGDRPTPPPDEAQHLAVYDDGHTITVVVNGHTLLGPLPAGCALASGIGVITTAATRHAILSFEAHPAVLDCPAELAHPPICPVWGDAVVFDEDFAEPTATLDGCGAPDLAGRTAPHGAPWQHTFGAEPFRLDGTGALVTTERSPGAGPLGKLRTMLQAGGHRNAYTVAWPDHAFADLTITAIPPGTGRGEDEAGRAGIGFWQDDDTCLVVSSWLDDSYGGASISTFLRFGGYEEMFDAVWTNVGDRIVWGRPFDLRVTFDGRVFWAVVDGDVVLYRAISDVYPDAPPLTINRVGILANWEFGDDTGSRFTRVVARAHRPGGGSLAEPHPDPR